MTYRACYALYPTSAIVLTTPDEADLPADALIESAIDEARRAGIIGDDTDAGQEGESDLRDRLVIGIWAA